MNKEYRGFIAPQPITPDQWVLGASNASPFPIVREDGNWTPLLPPHERQNIRGIETFNCTGFNTLNALEILMWHKFNIQVNYSDRWLGIIAETKAPGNDPHKVAEVIRKYGLIPESMLPFSDDIQNADEYYSFKGFTQSQIDACYAEGRKWLEMYNFNHKWVYKENQPLQEKINNMKVGLKSSPLGIAVFAWASDARDVYYANGDPNHWTTVYNIDRFLEVIDTYEPFRKLVEQNIIWCKMYSIEKKAEITEEQRIGFLAQLQKLFNWLIGIKKQVESLPTTTPPTPVLPQVEQPTPPVKKDLLTEFCLAIRDYEGKPGDLNYRNNNPGNIRSKEGPFMKFKTMDEGMAYLKEYVKRAARGEHRAYKIGGTIKDFFHVYAPTLDNNNPDKYAEWVAKRIGVDVNFKIIQLL